MTQKLTWPWKVTSWPRVLKLGTIGFLSWRATRWFLFRCSNSSRSTFSKFPWNFPSCFNGKRKTDPYEWVFRKMFFFAWFYDHRMDSRCTLIGQACISKYHQYSPPLIVGSIWAYRWVQDAYVKLTFPRLSRRNSLKKNKTRQINVNDTPHDRNCMSQKCIWW